MPTESMAVMTAKNNENTTRSAEVEAAVQLVRQARKQGLALTGPDGLLKQFTKTVLETALDEEEPSTWVAPNTRKAARAVRRMHATAPRVRR